RTFQNRLPLAKLKVGIPAFCVQRWDPRIAPSHDRGQPWAAPSRAGSPRLAGKVDEGVQAAREAEIGKRVVVLDSGKAKTTSWAVVRRGNLTKLPHARM